MSRRRSTHLDADKVDRETEAEASDLRDVGMEDDRADATPLHHFGETRLAPSVQQI